MLKINAKIIPPLDPHFIPASLWNRAFLQYARENGPTEPLKFALERERTLVSTYETIVPTNDPLKLSPRFAERLLKFLLWQRGGWKVSVVGPTSIVEYLQQIYSLKGARAFDVQLMTDVYEKPFSLVQVPKGSFPQAHESGCSLGGHLKGCRIGFDLGASDYKIAAVKDGEAVFTTELPWTPRVESDPNYHIQKIQEGLKLAASRLPRVDAIGGSSAGVYIDNKVMVASLFRSVPKEIFSTKVKPLFLDLQKQWGVPLEVANDGDVTALAGAMSLQATGVLGIAMGSSEAVGFLNKEGRILGWLNELAFAPIDYAAHAPGDEWSGDLGVGATYFSQQAVARLAPLAGIELPTVPIPEQLQFVQELNAKGDARTRKLFQTIGVYLGYALAHYADLYDYQHVLILGRVTSGPAGDQILSEARKVLSEEFPEILKKISLHLPDEKSKRVGQAVAAASLPAL